MLFMASYPIPFRSLSAVAAGFLALGLSSARAETPAAAAKFHREIEPLLQNYCYECHGDGAKKGKVSFDTFGSDKDIFANPTLWLTALKNVRAGLMPPPEDSDAASRPTADEIKKLETWIKFDAFGIDPANPDPGRVTVRRLNRAEYRNSIRDLMGVDFASDIEFPPDDTGHGFDNLGEVLTVSPLLLEKYLQAAEEIVDKAVPRVSRVPIKRVIAARDFRREERAAPVDGVEKEKVPEPAADAPQLSNAERETARRDLNVRRGGKSSHTFTITQAGTYKLSFEASVRSTFDFDTGRANAIVYVDGVEKQRTEVVWGSKNIRFESEQTWTEGAHQLTFEVEPLTPTAPNPVDPPPFQFQRPPEVALPAVAAVAVAAPGATPVVTATPAVTATPNAVVAVADPATPGNPAAPAAAGRRGAAGGRGINGNAPRPVSRSVDLRITSAELIGPMDEKLWVPPENYRRFFAGDPPSDPKARDAFAEKVLRDFTTKAFRRPVDDAKVTQLVSVARSVYSQPNKKFEDGIARAIMGVLASPRFLFRIEEPAASEAKLPFASVDEYALASRLSYFLWSSMPDEELFRLAAQGELRKQLPQQFARMLKDSKSQAFVKNFPGQWLQARDIESVPINAKAVLGLGDVRGNRASPIDLNAALRRMMRSETEMYFEYVLRENRSVLEFIESDYAFLNGRLATHYGVPGVTGEEIKKVTLPPDSPRGGMLTQGTVLAVTSNPTRTSPVKRGLFVLENFLGTPPPPPPPDIPALEESQKATDGRELTLREALASHRSNALCASCHARMDPLGFALENFNAMGNWRELDAKQPIDPAGKLATGEPFANIRELKHVLTHERHSDYYRCLTEKMLIYALGRSLDYYDVQTVDEIVARLEQDGGHFSTLLEGVINSVPFQKQRNLRASPGSTADASAAPASTVAQVSIHSTDLN
jgi:Protein of unknown function (DUF1592)/Protein of unknown function (DUF1588)/Protein of unknown function (DUF1587)/Protein of unknown function (DUF1585)/Protein of unknown function (DUF1595)